MPTLDELKAQTQAAIDARSAWLIDIAKTILNNPEAVLWRSRRRAMSVKN